MFQLKQLGNEGLDCRFAKEGMRIKGDPILCTKKCHIIEKKTPNLLTCTNRRFIFETEEIMLFLHGLQAISQLFPKGKADQVERVQRRVTNRSEVWRT